MSETQKMIRGQKSRQNFGLFAPAEIIRDGEGPRRGERAPINQLCGNKEKCLRAISHSSRREYSLASTRGEYTVHIDASEFQWREVVHMPIEALAQVALFWPM